MTSVEDFAAAIFGELESFSEEVDRALKEEVDLISKEAKKNLETNSKIPKKTGEYVKGFRVKKTAEGEGFYRKKVCNKKYQITHLLEKGHATKNGGRTKAYPHWKYAQEIADKLPDRFARRLEKK